MKEDATLDEIIKALDERDRLIKWFAARYDRKSFQGYPRATTGLYLIVVSPSFDHEGGWRLTRFERMGRGGRIEPIGHTELPSYLDAVKEAAREYGVNLMEAMFAP